MLEGVQDRSRDVGRSILLVDRREMELLRR